MKDWILFLFLLLGSFGLAEAADKSPCKKDMETFCKDVPARSKAMVECLKNHETELSKECHRKYEDSKARLRHTRISCQNDVEKFCGEVRPGAGALPKCLHAHFKDLSPECKESLESNKKKSAPKK
jgi:hypothetical protein